MTAVLAAFGVNEDSERLYRRVLRVHGQHLEQQAVALGWSLYRAQAAHAPLAAARLVRTDLDGALVADHPRTAISRLVERETNRLDAARRELDDVRAAVNDFAADHRAGRGEVIAPTAIEVLPAEGNVAIVEELLRTTTGVLRATHLDVASGTVTDPTVYRLLHAQIGSGRELRSIYPVSVLDDPVLLDWVGDWAAVGEQQRVVEGVPHDYVVFGEEAVVARLHWGATDGETVVIRLPLLVHAFTGLFDDAWTGGLPLPDRADEQDMGLRLLTLLAAGFKDEAIARYLGVGVRTVRRRVAEVMDELGVHTRFQLGVAAERRSLLGRARR